MSTRFRHFPVKKMLDKILLVDVGGHLVLIWFTIIK